MHPLGLRVTWLNVCLDGRRGDRIDSQFGLSVILKCPLGLDIALGMSDYSLGLMTVDLVHFIWEIEVTVSQY